MRNPENLRRYCSRSFNNSMSQMLFIEQNFLSPPHTHARARVHTHTHTLSLLSRNLHYRKGGQWGWGKVGMDNILYIIFGGDQCKGEKEDQERK